MQKVHQHTSNQLQEKQDCIRLLDQDQEEYARISNYLAWWQEGFSVKGIRNLRLGDVLETVNGYLQDYCQQLFDGEILVQLDGEKEQKTTAAIPVVSVKVDGPAGCYELSSGGQARKIDLAIHLALRRLAQGVSHGWRSNVLIADEVLDHLDRVSAQRVIQVLSEEVQRVFIISHDPTLQSLCDDVLRVHYEDETTRLKED